MDGTPKIAMKSWQKMRFAMFYITSSNLDLWIFGSLFPRMFRQTYMMQSVSDPLEIRLSSVTISAASPEILLHLRGTATEVVTLKLGGFYLKLIKRIPIHIYQTYISILCDLFAGYKQVLLWTGKTL